MLAAATRNPAVLHRGKRFELAGTWTGLLAFLFFGLSFWPMAGFLPPLSSRKTAVQVAHYVQLHTNGIRAGMICMNIAGALFCVLVVTIAGQVRRIRDVGPMMSNLVLVTGAVGSVVIILGGMVMTAVAFRPHRSVEVTYMMSDFAWLMIIMPAATYALMNGAVGAAILADSSTAPVFPRWVGYFNLWVGLLFLPGLAVTFFKSGPLAWYGVLGFWVPAAAFGSWFIVMFIVLRRAITAEQEQPC